MGDGQESSDRVPCDLDDRRVTVLAGRVGLQRSKQLRLRILHVRHRVANVVGPCFLGIATGLVIGKAGATIREIEARSKARVSIQEGKGGPGMATLSVVGDDRAAESVRMMVNNAVGGGKR